MENAPSGITILKYHYLDTLRIEPESLKLEPVWLMEDPIPFIKVENGNCSAFSIHNP